MVVVLVPAQELFAADKDFVVVCILAMACVVQLALVEEGCSVLRFVALVAVSAEVLVERTLTA